MMDGVYAAISGLEANQTMLDVTANDLANVNTVGYKGAGVTFSDALTQITRGAAGPTADLGGTNPIQVGLGVQVSAIDPNMSSGTLQPTGNPLDVAIEGNGFLRVGNGTPPATAPYTAGVPTTFDYTRAGNLTTDAARLPHHAGGPVRDRPQRGRDDHRRRHDLRPGHDRHLPPDPHRLGEHLGRHRRLGELHRRELVVADLRADGHRRLPVAGDVPEPERPAADRHLELGRVRQNSGAETVGTPGTAGYGQTIGGQLEQSNVDLASDMSQMITAQNGYDANSRVIQTADAMLQTLMQSIQ